MRWPWRRRRESRVVFIGGSPFDAVPPPVVQPPAPPPPGEPPAAPAPPRAATVQQRVTHVELGFADGSTMTLRDDDPRAVALRQAAARLTGST